MDSMTKDLEHELRSISMDGFFFKQHKVKSLDVALRCVGINYNEWPDIIQLFWNLLLSFFVISCLVREIWEHQSWKEVLEATLSNILVANVFIGFRR